MCRRVVEGILEALEKMKPTSIVGVELQEVELGSSAPQILGVEVDELTAVLTDWGVQEAYGRSCRRGVAASFAVDVLGFVLCWPL